MDFHHQWKIKLEVVRLIMMMFIVIGGVCQDSGTYTGHSNHRGAASSASSHDSGHLLCSEQTKEESNILHISTENKCFGQDQVGMFWQGEDFAVFILIFLIQLNVPHTYWNICNIIQVLKYLFWGWEETELREERVSLFWSLYINW